ncbi:MAG: hypothetical protein ACP5OK_01380 [Thermoprotei archaeon]
MSKILRARINAEDVDEARSVRRRMADWDFINNQPPKIREALKYYIETGDIRRASYLAGLDIDDFREMLRKAKVPVVV